MPDERFDWLVEVYKPQNKIPAFLTCIDIAGLTAGASTGAGLGNAFLSHVRAVDGIFQMVRAFDDAEVIHVDGDVDPVRDMQTISTELRLKDIEWVEKAIEVLKKAVRSTGSVSLADKAKREELATVERIHAHLLDDKDVRKGQWTNKEVRVVPASYFTLPTHNCCSATPPYLMIKSETLYKPSSSKSGSRPNTPNET